MIVATIGNSTFQLENIKDAEILLDIANRATLIERSFDIEFRDYYYVGEGEKRIGIEVIESKTIHPIEFHQEILRARRAREKESAEAKKIAESA